MSSDTRDEYPPELLRELEAYELPPRYKGLLPDDFIEGSAIVAAVYGMSIPLTPRELEIAEAFCAAVYGPAED
jgi:hypothetical protein